MDGGGRTTGTCLAVLALVLAGCGSGGETRSGAERTGTTERTSTTTTTGAFREAQDVGYTVDGAYRGTGSKVVVLGDSLVANGHAALRAELDHHAVAIGALQGEGFTPGAWTADPERPAMSILADQMAALDPDVAVIELGTNDAWVVEPGPPLGTFDQILTSLDAACTVGVLVAAESPAAGYDPARADLINDAYRDQVDVVVDYLETAPEGAVGPDGIHLTPTGQAELYAAVEAGVEAC